MITTRRFLNIFKSKAFDHCTVQEVGTNTTCFVDKVYISRKSKKIYFNDPAGKSVINTPFKTKDIANIYRIVPTNDDYTYQIELKDFRVFTVVIVMKPDYTPYILSSKKLMNYKAVFKAIPGYLDNLNGKDVIVYKTSYSRIFSYYNEEDNGDKHTLTESFPIHSFKYVCTNYNAVPSIMITSDNDDNVFTQILNVNMICDTDNGGIYISCENGEYYLEVIE